MAQPFPVTAPSWQRWLAALSAFGLGLLFIVAGVWKITNPLDTATTMVHALVPSPLALPAAFAAGVVETWGGFLLLVPRWRRWGALICGAMLVVFMAYFGYHYSTFKGMDCSCFPILKRAVGPGFFIGDTVMLVMGIAAWVWSRPSESARNAIIALGAVLVFSGTFLGATLARQTGLKAPDEIVVDGQPYSLQHGRVFLYFFDPECAYCHAGAVDMQTYRWKDVKVIVVPTVNPQFASFFLKSTKLQASVSNDSAKLREVFKFGNPPYGVMLNNGRQVQAFSIFEGNQPSEQLRKLGWIE